MTIKAVAMVRKIRDAHFEETRGMTPEDQIRYYRKKARSLSKGRAKVR
jgi:hypothetical protein